MSYLLLFDNKNVAYTKGKEKERALLKIDTFWVI